MSAFITGIHQPNFSNLPHSADKLFSMNFGVDRNRSVIFSNFPDTTNKIVFVDVRGPQSLYMNGISDGVAVEGYWSAIFSDFPNSAKKLFYVDVRRPQSRNIDSISVGST